MKPTIQGISSIDPIITDSLVDMLDSEFPRSLHFLREHHLSVVARSGIIVGINQFGSTC